MYINFWTGTKHFGTRRRTRHNIVLTYKKFKETYRKNIIKNAPSEIIFLLKL